MVTTAKSYQAKKLLKLPKEMPSNIVSAHHPRTLLTHPTARSSSQMTRNLRLK